MLKERLLLFLMLYRAAIFGGFRVRMNIKPFVVGSVFSPILSLLY